MHAFRYIVLSSTRAQAGALELCHCSCPTAGMLLGSPLSPSTCWAPSTGVAPSWNQHWLLPVEAESAPTHGQAPEHGRWPRPVGTPQQGLQGQQSPCLALHSLEYCPGWLFWSGLFTIARSSVEPPFNAPAWQPEHYGRWLQGAPFKSSSMTAGNNFLMGSTPSSTCSLHLLDQQLFSYSNCRDLWGGTRCECVSPPPRVSPVRRENTVHLSSMISTDLTSVRSCCVLSRLTWRLVLTMMSEEILFFKKST